MRAWAGVVGTRRFLGEGAAAARARSVCEPATLRGRTIPGGVASHSELRRLVPLKERACERSAHGRCSTLAASARDVSAPPRVRAWAWSLAAAGPARADLTPGQRLARGCQAALRTPDGWGWAGGSGAGGTPYECGGRRRACAPPLALSSRAGRRPSGPPRCTRHARLNRWRRVPPPHRHGRQPASGPPWPAGPVPSIKARG